MVDLSAVVSVQGYPDVTATAAVRAGSSGPLIGARNKDISFADAQTAIGPLQAARTFMAAGPPARWVIPTDAFTGGKLPAGIAYFVSITSLTANIEPYVGTVPAGVDLRVIYQHEVENGKETPTQFEDNILSLRARIQAENPAVRTIMASAGQQYDDGDPCTDGRYIVPGLDGYYIDLYRPSLQQMVPAAQFDRFLNWHALLPTGKPWGQTELGIGAIDSPDPAAQVNARRVQLIPQDFAYWTSLPDFDAMLYWYTKSSDPADHNYRFTDQESIDAFRALPRAA